MFGLLLGNVYVMVVAQVGGDIDYKMFQVTFGMLLTLLIALEFRNSIDTILEGRGLLAQVRIVVLSAIIALARKFLVIDTKKFEAELVAACGMLTLALGGVYWLLTRKRYITASSRSSSR